MQDIRILTVRDYQGFVPQRFLDSSKDDIVILREDGSKQLVLLNKKMYWLLKPDTSGVVLNLGGYVGCLIEKKILDIRLSEYELIGSSIIRTDINSLQN